MALVFLMTINVLCNAQGPKPVKNSPKEQISWQSSNLKGKVKSTIELNYKAYASSEKDQVTNRYVYDSAGNCIEKALILAGGRFGERYTFRYDKDGYNIEMKSFYENGRLRFKVVYKYDELGNKIESHTYDTLNRVTYASLYTYDQQGNPLSRQYTGVREYKETYTYVYDKAKRPLYVKMVSTGGNWEQKEYSYYGDTLVDESWKGFFGNGHVQTVYNSKKQMVTYRSPGDNTSLSFDNTYKYDAAGNKIMIMQTQDKKVLESPYSSQFEYVYDDKGNWIKKTTISLDGKPMSAIEREIEYYL